MLQRLQGVTRAVFSSSASPAGREVATAADKKIFSDETKLSVGSRSQENFVLQKLQLKDFNTINHCTDQWSNNNTIGEKRFPVNEV